MFGVDIYADRRVKDDESCDPTATGHGLAEYGGPLYMKRIDESGTDADIRLPGKGNSNFHGARPVHSIITIKSGFELVGCGQKSLSLLGNAGSDHARGSDRPAQSLEPPWGRDSRLQRCSGTAAAEQDPCRTVIATSKVNWATTLDCVITIHDGDRLTGLEAHASRDHTLAGPL